MKKKKSFSIVPYLFILPALFMVIVFLYLSVGLAFVTALTDRVATPRPYSFIGLKNFKDLLSDKIFWLSFRNQFAITIFAVFHSIFYPLLSAIILYFVKNQKVSRVIKTLFVLPMLVPGIVTILNWKFLYNQNFGFNSILQAMGLGFLRHNWLNDSTTALWCIILMGFPFVSGMYFLLFHSGINGIDSDLYSAAKVDGCSNFGTIRYVMLPGVKPYIRVVAMLALIGSLSGFGQVSALTDGGPGYNTMIPALYMYKLAFGDGKQGYSSAVGVVISLIIFALTLLSNKLLSGKEDE